MKIMIIDKIARIIKSKKKLEKILGVRITNRGKEVKIEGGPEKEYIAEKVFDALDFGFPFDAAILIKTENFDFEIINIKDHTKRPDLDRVRGRIIGKGGATLRVLNQLTGCFFELKGNQIGIVCSPENMQISQDAVISLIKGSKQSNVYKMLEGRKNEPVVDLGLRKTRKK